MIRWTIVKKVNRESGRVKRVFELDRKQKVIGRMRKIGIVKMDVIKNRQFQFVKRAI